MYVGTVIKRGLGKIMTLIKQLSPSEPRLSRREWKERDMGRWLCYFAFAFQQTPQTPFLTYKFLLRERRLCPRNEHRAICI